jgi:glycosyltransferase involved in cell wall biosynthesis
MNLLVLPKYDALGASSRVRMNQYFSEIEKAGHKVVCSPLLSNTYITQLQRGHIALGYVFHGYLQRLFKTLEFRRFDVVWIEKECFPWLPAGFEIALNRAQTPFVLDYDDADFHKYDSHASRMIRLCLSRKHQIIIKKASLVIAGNDYLANYAKSNGAKHVEIIPSVIDLRRYHCVKQLKSPGNFVPTVGWVGQSSTAKYLKKLGNVFRNIKSQGIAKFCAVGITPSHFDLPMDGYDWSEASEVNDILRMDIGIMPLSDGLFERGKCGYKLIQYMGCGLPVIASPVGVNTIIVDHGLSGFLAETEEEWYIALTRLICDPDLRHRMGLAGRRKVERLYSLQSRAPRMISLLEGVASHVVSPVR